MFSLSVCSACVCIVVFTCVVLHAGDAAVEGKASDPCHDYSDCIKPASVPVSRIIFALFSLNLFRLADEGFLLETCQNVQDLEGCATSMEMCLAEGGAQARHFANSDVTLAQWVCDNRETFATYSSCWDDPFLAEMSECTGFIDFLAPVDCLTEKINNLEQCSLPAKEFFLALLTKAHEGY